MELTLQQREDFDRDGFVLVENLFNKAEVSHLREETEHQSPLSDDCLIRATQ